MPDKRKIFKDPIYGYIEVDSFYVSTFIDTPCFQRLRYIMQTSYAPVYTNAFHNRFSHSLGVFHLGKIVYEQIKSFLQDKKEHFGFEKESIDWVNDHEKVFLAACILHDVGHAPFSHTGEIFYETFIDDFFDSLNSAVGDQKFTKDVEDAEKTKIKPNPHEYMSVIIALQTFKDFFVEEPENKDFFARCITGLKYTAPNDDLTQIKNCIIELLNSKLIDVDRLDYIIRDAFMSGYQNVAIDYNRLLRGMVIIRDKTNKIKLAYHKSAMSIIDNVIFAHDGERKWIQSQPVILYDIFLLDYCIRKVNAFFVHKSDRTRQLFSINSLTEFGNSLGSLFENGSTSMLNIALLSDVDIIFFIKNVTACQDSLTQELFNRNLRRHPLWKSEEEYNHFLGIVGTQYKDKIDAMFTEIGQLIREFTEKTGTTKILPVINDNLFEFITKESKNTALTSAEKSKFERCREYFKIMKDFSNERNIAFDFKILPAKAFQSNFSKIERKDLLIWYDYNCKSADEAVPMQPILTAGENKESKYLYFYIKRHNNEKINKEEFIHLFKDLAEKYISLN